MPRVGFAPTYQVLQTCAFTRLAFSAYYYDTFVEYIICTSQRTGSTLLANTLKSMNVGLPDEFFNTLFSSDLGNLPLDEYIAKLKETQTSNGTFGFKIHYCQIEQFKLYSEIPKLFPSAKYIWLYRRNTLRQAISLWKAICTQSWNSSEAIKNYPHYDYVQICQLMIKLTEEIECWENFFDKHRIKPLKVVYENLDKNYYPTISRVLRFLGVKDRCIPSPVLERQSDSITEFWIKKFMQRF